MNIHIIKQNPNKRRNQNFNQSTQGQHSIKHLVVGMQIMFHYLLNLCKSMIGNTRVSVFHVGSAELKIRYTTSWKNRWEEKFVIYIYISRQR